MKSVITIFVLLFIISSYPQNYKQVKIFINSISDLTELQRAGLEIDHSFRGKDNSITVFLSDDEFSKLQFTNFNYQVLIEDWFKYYANLPTLSESEKSNSIKQSRDNFGVNNFGYGSMGGFYTLAEVYAELDKMKQLFPDLITTKTSIGSTIENRPIYVVKISDNPDVDEDEAENLYTALHHAREPQSMMQLIYFMYYLLENYNTNNEVQYLVNNREMFFIPVVNPDGYQYNYTINPQGGGMWRKNRRNNGTSYGVDLNRNYGPQIYWNAPNDGSSTLPNDDTYRGTAPFSEPETINIKNFLAERKIKTTLNYHTYGNLLVCPYGALEVETSDSLIFREFGTDMTNENGYTFGTDQQTVGYSTRGNSDDYFYDGDTLLNSGKIFAMTPEVGSTGFWPQQNEIFPLAIENLKPNLYYAWVAGESVRLLNPYFSKKYLNAGDTVDLIIPAIRNKGLADANNISLAIKSNNPLIKVISGELQVGNIAARTTVSSAGGFSFALDKTIPANTSVIMYVTIYSNDVSMITDSIEFRTGTPTIVFQDTTDDPLLLWNITSTSQKKWQATDLTFHSSPACFTESKTGNYNNNSVIKMTLKNSIDLSSASNPKLNFWTKFDIENGWDYGQINISTNNGNTFVPLEGKYTTKGEGQFQPIDEPLYDGIKSDWVKEEIDLSNYKSSSVKLQFEFNSDDYLARDGWYIDDIEIADYNVVLVEDDLGQATNFLLEQNYPNPFNPVTVINWMSPVSGWNSLKIYDVLGNEITSLVDEYKPAGNYSVEFLTTSSSDSKTTFQLSSGVYFYRLQVHTDKNGSGEFVQTKKMVLLR